MASRTPKIRHGPPEDQAPGTADLGAVAVVQRESRLTRRSVVPEGRAYSVPPFRRPRPDRKGRRSRPGDRVSGFAEVCGGEFVGKLPMIGLEHLNVGRPCEIEQADMPSWSSLSG